MKRNSVIIDEEKISSYFFDGMTLAIGEPAPMSIVRLCLQKKIKKLTLIASGIALDVLIASGQVDKVISYIAAGVPGTPILPFYRRAAENNEIEIWECDEGILTSGLEASGKGLPFLPWRGGIGTSIPELNKDLKIFNDPITNEKLIAVPAIIPDLAVLHADKSDMYGNIQHSRGPGWLDLFLWRASRNSVVQVEKIVSNEEIRSNPWATTISGPTGIIQQLWGAHPLYSRGNYIIDKKILEKYFELALAAIKNDDRREYDQFINNVFLNAKNHSDYLNKIGIKRFLELSEYPT
tara:strand:- start:64 stop:945 length:882 start_codon:yes stop_codon:yes gene_type:complete